MAQIMMKSPPFMLSRQPPMRFFPQRISFLKLTAAE